MPLTSSDAIRRRLRAFPRGTWSGRLELADLMLEPWRACRGRTIVQIDGHALLRLRLPAAGAAEIHQGLALLLSFQFTSDVHVRDGGAARLWSLILDDGMPPIAQLSNVSPSTVSGADLDAEIVMPRD